MQEDHDRVNLRSQQQEDIEYYRGYIIRKNQRKDYTEICKDEQCVDRVLGVSEASIKYTKLKIDKLIKGTEK